MHNFQWKIDTGRASERRMITNRNAGKKLSILEIKRKYEKNNGNRQNIN